MMIFDEHDNSAVFGDAAAENFTFVSAMSMQSVFPVVFRRQVEDTRSEELAWDAIDAPCLLADHPHLTGRVHAAGLEDAVWHSLDDVVRELGLDS